MKLEFDVKVTDKDLYSVNIEQAYKGSQGVISLLFAVLLAAAAVLSAQKEMCIRDRPCLITALSELNEPRYMTPGGIFDAFDKEVTVWGRAEDVYKRQGC